MTRSHAARRLLEHGPLTYAQFREVTGWPLATCRGVLGWLTLHGEVKREPLSRRRAVYRLVAA